MYLKYVVKVIYGSTFSWLPPKPGIYIHFILFLTLISDLNINGNYNKNLYLLPIVT